MNVSAYYVKKGLYCLLMWAPTAGATLEWFKKNFCDGTGYGELNALAESVPKGSEGLICIPHLCGTVVPENEPKVKGVFFGATLKHGKGHFVSLFVKTVDTFKCQVKGRISPSWLGHICYNLCYYCFLLSARVYFGIYF